MTYKVHHASHNTTFLHVLLEDETYMYVYMRHVQLKYPNKFTLINLMVLQKDDWDLILMV